MKSRIAVPLAIACAAFAFAPLCVTRVAAQSTSGIVEGRVINSANGEHVGNARLTVQGTLLEAFSQSDGSYRLTNVPAGTVTVNAFFTGLPIQSRSLTV